MAVAFDAAGPGFTGLVSAGATSTPYNHTVVTAGATVYADIAADRPSTLSNVTCGGSAMTWIGTTTLTGGAAGNGFIARYKLADAPAGNLAIQVKTSVAVWMAIDSVSYTGVGSEGSPQTSTGTGTSGSASPTCSAGSWILQSFTGNQGTGASNLAAFAATGGTNRTNLNVFGSNEGRLDLSTSDTATSGTTFETGTTVSMAFWGSLAHELKPDEGTDSPSTATVTIAGGTPIESQSSDGAQPPSATVTITGGTPSEDQAVSPAAAAVTVTPGTPQIYGQPLDGVRAKLNIGHSATIQVLGDSISYGFGDTVTTPWPHGWVGPFGILLGQYYNTSVSIKSWNDQGTIAGTGYPDAGDSGQFYDAAYSIYTGAGGSGILMVDGAACSKELNYLDNATRLPILLGTSNIDLIILADGINDYDVDTDSPTTFVSKYQTWLANIQTLCPGVPIVVTNENATNSSNDTHFVALFSALWTALGAPSNTYSGPSNQPGITLLNTRAAYTDLSTMVQPSGTSGGVHPMSEGYDAQALWMVEQLAPDMIQSPATATIQISGGTPDLSNPIATPPSAALVITGATPTLTQSDNATPDVPPENIVVVLTENRTTTV